MTTQVETDVKFDGQALDAIDDRTIVIERKVDALAVQVSEISVFCQRLAQMLDGMAANPMLAAMLPPGILGE